MAQSSYYLVLNYLKQVQRPVSPHELSVALEKSRVTIQSSLKRLLANGWVTKEGASPHAVYKALEVDPMPKTATGNHIDMEDIRNVCKIGFIEDFILKSHKIRYSKSMKPLICFDLDGTLTTESTWKVLNTKLGISDEDDSRLYHKYIAGEIPNYDDWMTELVDLHKTSGALVTKSDITALTQELPLATGAEAAIRDAKEKGYEILMLSGSVDTIVETMASRLGITNWLACSKIVYDDAGNVLDIQSTGHEQLAKLTLLENFCTTNGYTLKDVVSVGDGGNELEIFKVTKGILVGNNQMLAPVAWKKVSVLSEIAELI